MTGEPTHRALRVAHSVKRVATDFLARDVSDPVLAGVVVTDVEVTADLGIATIKIRLLVGGDDSERRQLATKGLARAGSRLRRNIGQALRLKRVPELRFVYDVGADASRRVEELLADIAREKQGE